MQPQRPDESIMQIPAGSRHDPLGKLSPDFSVFALVQTSELFFRYSLDQQTSTHACRSDTVPVKAIHLTSPN